MVVRQKHHRWVTESAALGPRGSRRPQGSGGVHVRVVDDGLSSKWWIGELLSVNSVSVAAVVKTRSRRRRVEPRRLKRRQAAALQSCRADALGGERNGGC